MATNESDMDEGGNLKTLERVSFLSKWFPKLDLTLPSVVEVTLINNYILPNDEVEYPIRVFNLGSQGEEMNLESFKSTIPVLREALWWVKLRTPHAAVKLIDIREDVRQCNHGYLLNWIRDVKQPITSITFRQPEKEFPGPHTRYDGMVWLIKIVHKTLNELKFENVFHLPTFTTTQEFPMLLNLEKVEFSPGIIFPGNEPKVEVDTLVKIIEAHVWIRPEISGIPSSLISN